MVMVRTRPTFCATKPVSRFLQMSVLRLMGTIENTNGPPASILLQGHRSQQAQSRRS
jgi:hypothetical protein